MIRISNILVSLLVILTACVAPKTVIQTQIIDTPTRTPIQTHPVIKTLTIDDGGLISNQPCESPCFFNIRIGETHLDQVVSILENDGISPCHQFNERIIVCGQDVSSIIIGADASTFIVDGVTYYPSILIPIGEIIKKYGNPNLVQVEPDGTPEATTVNLFLLWDSIKMRVDLPEVPDTGEQIYVIENTTEARKITFLNKISYSNLATSGFMQPWKGYNTYKP